MAGFNLQALEEKEKAPQGAKIQFDALNTLEVRPQNKTGQLAEHWVGLLAVSNGRSQLVPLTHFVSNTFCGG